MAGFGCFVFACGVAVLCLVLYFYMEKSPFYKYYTYFDEMMLSGKKHIIFCDDCERIFCCSCCYFSCFKSLCCC